MEKITWRYDCIYLKHPKTRMGSWECPQQGFSFSFLHSVNIYIRLHFLSLFSLCSPKGCWSPNTMNVILLANKVFVDLIVKVRPLGWAVIHATGPYYKRGSGWRHTHCKDSHMKTETEVGIMLPGAIRDKEGASLTAFRRSMALPAHLFWTSGLQTCERINFCYYKPLHLCYFVMTALGNEHVPVWWFSLVIPGQHTTITSCCHSGRWNGRSYIGVGQQGTKGECRLPPH